MGGLYYCCLFIAAILNELYQFGFLPLIPLQEGMYAILFWL